MVLARAHRPTGGDDMWYKVGFVHLSGLEIVNISMESLLYNK
jgi:hypothetical protein